MGKFIRTTSKTGSAIADAPLRTRSYGCSSMDALTLACRWGREVLICKNATHIPSIVILWSWACGAVPI
jgi:hypothetical protein